jgi:hypothetical protein
VDSIDAVTQPQHCSGSGVSRQPCGNGKVQTKSSVQAALQERFIVILGPQCWSPDAVPQLDANR